MSALLWLPRLLIAQLRRIPLRWHLRVWCCIAITGLVTGGVFWRKARVTAEAKIQIDAFLDKNPRIQSAASQHLVQMGGKAVPTLVEAMGHKEPQVRWWAATTLGELGAAAVDAVPVFVTRFKIEEDKTVVCANAKAAGKLRIAQLIPQLILLLDQRDESLRAAAAWSLGRMPADEEHANLVNAALADLLIDEDLTVQTAAREAFMQREERIATASAGGMNETLAR